MTINFTMSEAQKKLQYDVRAFAENVLAPVVPVADREPDALKAFAMTKPAYIESYRAGIAMCMLPKEYGGGGVSCVDLVIARGRDLRDRPGLRLYRPLQRPRPDAHRVVRH